MADHNSPPPHPQPMDTSADSNTSGGASSQATPSSAMSVATAAVYNNLACDPKAIIAQQGAIGQGVNDVPTTANITGPFAQVVPTKNVNDASNCNNDSQKQNNIPMAVPDGSTIPNNNNMMATLVSNHEQLMNMAMATVPIVSNNANKLDPTNIAPTTKKKNAKRLNSDVSTSSVAGTTSTTSSSVKKKRKRAKRSDAGVPRPERRTAGGGGNVGVGNQSYRSAAAAHRKGNIHIPPISSPGLLIIPTSSVTSAFPPITSEEEARKQWLVKVDMSNNGLEEEYLLPSTVFSQSMIAGGYTSTKRRDMPHRGSSTDRCVGDMFDSDVNAGLYVHFPELVPRSVWERRLGENYDRYVEVAPVKDNISPGKIKRERSIGSSAASLSADVKALEESAKKKGPKGARSSYIFFTNAQRKLMTNEFPGMRFTEQGVIMGERWRALTPEEKKPYEDVAIKDKERYTREMKEYIDSVRQEIREEKKEENGGEEHVKKKDEEEKKESPVKEDPPKEEDNKQETDTTTTTTTNKEEESNVKEESKDNGAGREKPKPEESGQSTKTPKKRRKAVKGPRLVDAMILSLSKMLGEKVNRRELPPQGESEEEDEEEEVETNGDRPESVSSRDQVKEIDYRTTGVSQKASGNWVRIIDLSLTLSCTHIQSVYSNYSLHLMFYFRLQKVEFRYQGKQRTMGTFCSQEEAAVVNKVARVMLEGSKDLDLSYEEADLYVTKAKEAATKAVSGGVIPTVDSIATTTTVARSSPSLSTSQPKGRRRVSPDLKLEELPQFIPSSTQPQTRHHTTSSHTPHTFLDMLPVSLTAAYSPSYVAKRRAYAEAVLTRERAIIELQEAKDDADDAQEKYTANIEIWQRMCEYQKGQITKRAQERKRQKEIQAAKDAAEKKLLGNDEKSGGDNQDAKQDTIQAAKDAAEKKLMGTDEKSGDNNVEDGKQDAIHAAKVAQPERSVSPPPAEDPLDYMPPRPQPPGEPRVIKIPDIPIPPSPPQVEGNNDNDKPEPVKSEGEGDNVVPMRVPKVNQKLLSHLDPSCFLPDLKGRYLGLLSNHIADPQFCGPSAPGIEGTTYGGGTGLATSYAGGGKSATCLVSSSSKGGGLWQIQQPASAGGKSSNNRSSPPKAVPEEVKSSKAKASTPSSSKKRPASDSPVAASAPSSEKKTKIQQKRPTTFGMATGDRNTTATEISTGPAGVDFPDGWIAKCYRRNGGETVGKTDRFWFSPGRNIRFRAKRHAMRFIDVLKEPEVDGDEDKAAELYKSRGLHF